MVILIQVLIIVTFLSSVLVKVTKFFSKNINIIDLLKEYYVFDTIFQGEKHIFFKFNKKHQYRKKIILFDAKFCTSYVFKEILKFLVHVTSIIIEFARLLPK